MSDRKIKIMLARSVNIECEEQYVFAHYRQRETINVASLTKKVLRLTSERIKAHTVSFRSVQVVCAGYLMMLLDGNNFLENTTCCGGRVVGVGLSESRIDDTSFKHCDHRPLCC